MNRKSLSSCGKSHVGGEKRKIFKILEISSIFVGVIMALYYFYPVFASPPSTPYAPGETTDPTCSPGDTNCTVHPPLTTTLTTSTAIIMGTSSLRFAYDSTNFTALTIASNGALTVSSTNGVTTTFINKIVMDGGLTIAGVGATTTNFNVSGLTNIGLTTFTSATGTNLSITRLNPASDSGALTIGAPQGTGLITVGNSTVAQTLSLGIGTSSTVNIGTGPGTTTIAIGTGGFFGGIHIGATGVTTTIDGGLTIAGIGATSTNLYVSGQTNLVGRVGVNSTSPIASLALQGTGGTNPFSINSSTGASLLSILQNGNVGINSSSPIDTLSVQGGLRVVGPGVTTTNLAVTNIYGVGTQKIDIGTGITNGLLITASGGLYMNSTDVNIGNNSGSFYLDAFSASVNTKVNVRNSDATRIADLAVEGSVLIGTTTRIGLLTIAFPTSSPSLEIASSSGASMLRVLANGNVGINSSSPIDTLSVQGGLQVVGGVTTTNLYVSGVSNLGNTTISNVTTTNLSVSGSTNLILTGTAGQFPYYAANGFSLTNTSTLFILPTGRIGIGTTTPQSKLIIQGTGSENPFSIVSSTAAADSLLTVLTNGNVGINSSTPMARLSVQGTANNDPVFDVASSTGTSLFRVLADGRVGMGTVAPSAGVELHILAQAGASANIRLESGGGTAALIDVINGGRTIFEVGNALTLQEANGTVGIGTSTPIARLAVRGAGTENVLEIASSTNASLFRILTNGNVGVNSSTPMNIFSTQGEVSMMGLGVNVAGNGVCVTATGTITDAGAAACVPSALQFKTNVTPYTDSAVDLFKKLVDAGAIANYERKDKSGARKGLIADYVAEVDKDLVVYKDDQIWSLNFEDFTGLAVKAISELDDKISNQQTATYPLDPACDAKGNCPQVGDAVCAVTDPYASFFIEQCSATSTDSIIGVVSGNSSTSSQSVALNGQVSVNVSAANGPIKAGDYLTSSAVPGVAVKAIEPGKVIGMALEAFDGSASVTGSIKISINTSWSFGSLFAADISGEMPNFASVVMDKFTLAVKNSLRKLGLLIKDGIATVKEVFAEKVTTKQLCVGNTCVNEQQLQDILNKTQTQAATNQTTPLPDTIESSTITIDASTTIDISTTTVDTSTTTTPLVIPTDSSTVIPSDATTTADEGSLSDTNTTTP